MTYSEGEKLCPERGGETLPRFLMSGLQPDHPDSSSHPVAVRALSALAGRIGLLLRFPDHAANLGRVEVVALDVGRGLVLVDGHAAEGGRADGCGIGAVVVGQVIGASMGR